MGLENVDYIVQCVLHYENVPLLFKIYKKVEHYLNRVWYYKKMVPG
jgi:hypothetical protein